MALLFAANVVNYVDRQILSMLQDPIKAELNLSDTQLGMLTGLSFALFYATLGLPIARLADTHRRSRIIAASIALWSVMTAACSAAGSFVSLMACRIGVGIGEAGLSPSAHSLITDTFEPRRRAGALAVYSVGIQVGVMLGYLLAGWLHGIFGWRTAFLAIGLAGLPLALLVLKFVPEPQRGRFDQTIEPGEGPGSLAQGIAAIWRNRPCRLVLAACGLHAIVLYGHGHWTPPFLGRAFAMPLGDIALWMACLALFAGGSGIWLSGKLADRADVHAPDGSLRIATWSLVVLIPCEIGFVMAPNVEAVLSFSALVHFLGGFYLAPAISFLHGRVAPTQRALASATLLLAINLVGLGIGPLAVGVASDALTDPMGVAPALRIALILLVPAQLAALLLFRSARQAIVISSTGAGLAHGQ